LFGFECMDHHEGETDHHADPSTDTSPGRLVLEPSSEKSALGAFFRRIAARRGVPKAITATAYKLARIVYQMLKHGQEYAAQGMEAYEQAYRERVVRNLQRKAKELGYDLVAKAEAGAVSGG
jgi:hypothetical protein